MLKCCTSSLKEHIKNESGGKEVTEWSERVAKNLKFPRELHNAIENYRKQNMIPYFSTAVYELIRKGLQAAEKEKER